MTVWDVVVHDGKKPASIVDGGYYPKNGLEAIKFVQNTRHMLGIENAPVGRFDTKEAAYAWLETAPADAIAMYAFDWDKENW